MLGTDNGWPYSLGFGFLVAMLQILTLPFSPRSPRYLLLNLNKEAETVQGTAVLVEVKQSSNLNVHVNINLLVMQTC